MRVGIKNAEGINSVFKTGLYSESAVAVCAEIFNTQTKNQRQDIAIDNAVIESETIIALMMLDDHVSNNDNIHLPIMQNSKKSLDKILKIYKNKRMNYKETHVPMGDKTTWHTLDIYKDKVGTAVKTKKNKENLRKTSNCDAAGQKTTKRSKEMAQSTPLDGILYKKSKTGKYCETLKLPPFDYIRSKKNNNMFDKNTPYYENIKQQELYQYNLNDGINASQYLDHNNLKYADQQVMNFSPCFVASKNTQNFPLNNIINTQAQPVQSDFINDRQYHGAANFNRPKETGRNRSWQPSENHSSINSIETYKLLPVENKVPSSYNICTSYTRNNTYTDIQHLPGTSAASQQIANNITSYYIPLAVDSNNLPNMTADGHPRIERLYYKPFIDINCKHNSGCRILSLQKENGMPPPNNMNCHVIAPYDLNLNILPDRSVVPDALPPRSLYTDSTNALSNTCNSNIVKENVVADRYREKHNFNQYTMPAFENSLFATNGYQINSNELMNDLSYSILSQNITIVQDLLMLSVISLV